MTNNKALEIMKIENRKRTESINKLGRTKKVKKIQAKGFTLINTASAHICGGIYKLESELKNGILLDKVSIVTNSKTGEIPGICFPNIFLQTTFMRLIKANPQLLELQSVALLMEYFQENKMCHNCENCSGLCYNNKDIVQYPGKGISELRNLLAYIVNPNGLRDKIKRAAKFRTVFRINIDGELHNEKILNFWLNIAETTPRTTFYTYTKSYELIENHLKENNFPSNFIMNMSIIEGTEEKMQGYEKLHQGNKFKTVMNLPADAKNVCIGDCTECELCYTNLAKENNTIYCLYHN